MIVVRVELWSAVTGKRTELARAIIDSIGGTEQLGEYRVRTLRGRSEAALDQAMIRMAVTREGRVHRHPRLREHVWTLVAKAMVAVGYVPQSLEVTRFHTAARRLGLMDVDQAGA